MSKSISLEIERAWDLLNEGKVSKIKETLKLINKIENKENLEPEEKLTFSHLRGLAMMGLYRLEETIRIGEQLDKDSKVLDKPLFSIDALYLKFCALYTYGMWPYIVEDINNCELLLKSVTQEPTSEIEPREATFYFMKGYLHNFKGEFNLAIELQKKSLAIYERYPHYSFMIPNCLEILGEIYEGKGELEMALNSHKNALELSEGKNMLIIVSAISFYYIGKIYYQQGKLDQAIEFLKKDMNILENIDTLLGINLPHYSGLVYDTLIRIYLDKNSIDVAREYMARFQKYNTEKKIPSFIFYLSKARLLKSSNRTRDRADAERELRKIIESSGEKSKFYSLSFSPVYTPALIELCDLYFGEYKTTHNSEILEEIQPLIEMLLKESERVNSYALQAQTLFLQAKLSLLQMNMGDARRYLTKAQRIAEEHNLQLLARSVSKEHDKLLEFLDKLENTRVSEIPITERIDLASLGEIIAQMQGKRTLDPPEIVDEQPILLLIIGQDGVSYFSHPFVEDWDFDDIFGSFMSTFNTFSSEIFEKSIDRIRIDDNFILINHVEQFLVCYVIKGQSYPGLQKLNRFSDAIKWKPDIWEALNKAVQTSELLEFDNPSSLGEVVNEIFNL